MEKYLIYDFSEYGFAREPVIRRMPGGTLVCAFLTGGTAEPQNANVVMLSHSNDDGRTWTQPRTAVSHSERGCWATEIFTQTERPFIAVHTYNTNSYKREHYRELQTFRLALDGNGQPVGEPVSFCGLNGVSVRQGFRMSDGEIFFPVYWQEVLYDFDWATDSTARHGGQQRYPFRCGCAVSRDGVVFERFGYLDAPASVWEPTAVELEKGHIMMLMRSDAEAFLRRSDSFDFGRTWTKPAVTDIENAHTKPSLFKIVDTVFLVNNFVQAQGLKNRTHLQIRATRDGVHWRPACKPEEDDANFFYPHPCVSEETKTVYLAYEDGVKHFLVRIGFDELFADGGKNALG